MMTVTSPQTMEKGGGHGSALWERQLPMAAPPLAISAGVGSVGPSWVCIV
jgi:hypothetical protein